MRGRLREVERLELLGDGVQAAQRPAVVVLVVALDERQREAVQRPGTTVDLLKRVPHGALQAKQVDRTWTGHRLGGRNPGGPVNPRRKTTRGRAGKSTHRLPRIDPRRVAEDGDEDDQP